MWDYTQQYIYLFYTCVNMSGYKTRLTPEINQIIYLVANLLLLHNECKESDICIPSYFVKSITLQPTCANISCIY